MRYLLALPALAASAYWLLALIAALRHWFERPVPAGALPPVSILKPIHGRDPGLYDALRTHALQDYPEYEILFGFNRVDDPAFADVRRLIGEFPQVRMRSIKALTDAPNGKVGVLERLAAEARHPVLLVNDSDIAVGRDYLKRVVPPLAAPATSLVTCLYRASSPHFPGKFEALGISTDFAPGVLVSRLIGMSRFALGSTMVFRAAGLRAMGGFAAIRDHIADDYELGRRLSSLGGRVVLSHTVVETTLQGRRWRDVWAHQLRWARTIRRAQPSGYAGLVITNAALWAALAALAGLWQAAALALGVRMLAGLAVGVGILRDTQSLLLAPLIPLRDLWGLAVWAAGLAGDTVDWRGQRMRLSRGGRITPI